MKELDFSRSHHHPILPMRPWQNEHHGTKTSNDADSRPTLRTRVHRISLAAPLDAEAGTAMQPGLLTNAVSRLQTNEPNR
jgi:hypothetical protein